MKKIFLFWSLTILGLSACGPREAPLKEERYSGYAQGTTFNITVLSSSVLSGVERDLQALLEQVDASMSTYDSTSLISRVNRGERIQPDSLFQNMLRQSARIYRETDGYFDPSVGPLVRLWGFGPEARRSVDSSAVAALRPYWGFDKIDSSRFRGPFWLEPKMELDFNAIAQGYTVDLICDYFESRGVRDYLVEVGGELRCRGRNLRGELWRVGVDKPVEEIDQQDRFQFIVALDSMALATSGNYRKFWLDSASGQRYSHTISPKTGFPLQSRLLSATVLSHDAATADAYATAFMAMGLERALRFVQKRSGEPALEVYFVYSGAGEEWEVFMTPGLEDMLLNPSES